MAQGVTCGYDFSSGERIASLGNPHVAGLTSPPHHATQPQGPRQLLTKLPAAAAKAVSPRGRVAVTKCSVD
ncbi:hypothetical protein Pmani_032195 [Petrolisthes manimaculis]|uniref:Uncharacterized protein n=1 Tax=Petrolisthes manimaculis TaxID=1843537 RepID=A0AAE1NU80_9EUCA|nr:hypothetical protein Pmani_032195 [Petrolisthes manimaculis]